MQVAQSKALDAALLMSCGARIYPDREGATSSDDEICVGPAEAWGSPCYPPNPSCSDIECAFAAAHAPRREPTPTRHTRAGRFVFAALAPINSSSSPFFGVWFSLRRPRVAQASRISAATPTGPRAAAARRACASVRPRPRSAAPTRARRARTRTRAVAMAQRRALRAARTASMLAMNCENLSQVIASFSTFV